MKKVLSALLSVAILLTFAVFAMGSFDDNESTVEDNEVTEKQEEKTTLQKKDLTVSAGKSLKTDGLKIDYLSTGDYTNYSEWSPPKDGYKIIYIDLKVENIGNDDKYIAWTEFECYADDQAMEHYYGCDDVISATLSAGRSTSGKIYFEVPANSANIEIEYEIDFLSGEKAVFIVK